MTMVHDDEDEWTELGKGSTAVVRAPVTVKLSNWKTKKGVSSGARGFVSFRNEAADWLREHGPRFRVQIGGQNADRIRVIPDAIAGKFEFSEFKGVCRISLGTVNVWPSEDREAVECAWKRDLAGGFVILTLPKDFARPTPPTTKAAKAEPTPMPATAAPAPKPAVPKTSPAARVTDHRTYGVFGMGEPAPGRSALDQRLAAEKK